MRKKRITKEIKTSDSLYREYSVEGLGKVEVSIRCSVRGDWKGAVNGISGALANRHFSLSGFSRSKQEVLRIASRQLDYWIELEDSL